MSSTLQWLGRTTLALLLVAVLPQSARASFIDLVSQNYLIHAYGFGFNAYPVRDPVVDYTEVSNTPIHRYDDVLFNHGGGNVGLFVLSTSADGGFTPSSAFVRAQSDLYDASFGFADVAEATAAIAFRPLVNNLIVQAGVPIGPPGLPPSFYGGLGHAGLYDLSAGAAVLTLGLLIEPATYNVSLDLGHLYTLYASASGPARDGMLSISPGSNPIPTPESGSTLMFFVMGLGAVLLVARSQKFRPSN